MLQIIIALLMNLGVISAPADYYHATPDQQQVYQDIILEEEIDMN